MKDLILWVRLARMYRRRGWAWGPALSYSHALVYSGAYRG